MSKKMDLTKTDQLKAYLRRLRNGEDLESVRADFAKQFSEVDASDIMKAEQELIREGTPLAEVQRLCDVHSALFHGATREERIANAEKAVAESLRRQAEMPKADYTDKNEKARVLEAIPGHPLQTLTLENNALTDLLGNAEGIMNKPDGISEFLDGILEISVHYAKKGDLIYPHLKVGYGISGPSDVMWTVDDEIRDELAAISRETSRDEEWRARLVKALKRAEEMVYKEQNILFPICAVNFTEDEWFGIYQDSKDYGNCLGVQGATWEKAENADSAHHDKQVTIDGEISMPGGHLTLEQLTALLNTMPLEISFVDKDNINRFFNEGPKVFKRPGMAIDREVFSCHPPKIEPMVRAIIDDFRNGRRDCMPIWMEKGGKSMLVTYMAVRDKDGRYLGTMELVQDMEFAKEHFHANQDSSLRSK